MRSPRPTWLAVFASVAALAHAASFDERVEALFRPVIGERIALSPDGQRVAYTSRAGAELTLVIRNVENPGPRRTVKLEPARDAAGANADARAPVTSLRFLRWATADRLVYAPAERIVPLPPVTGPDGRPTPNPDGPTIVSPILAVDADGKQHGVVVDARDFQETPEEARHSLADLLRTPKELAARRGGAVQWRMPHLDIAGFHPRDREQLIVTTRGAYSMPMQHLVDLRTGNVREFGDEWPAPPGEPHVFDWFRLKTVGEHQLTAARPATTWRDDNLAKVQHELAAKFPRRVVELLDWSDSRGRVLFSVTGGTDPGRVFVYQRSEELVVEILHRAPWLDATKLHETRFFEFTASDGAPLSGYATWPSKPRVDPPPLLVVFPAGFPGRAQPAFDPEAQVFADLGFAVVRLNHRSVAGVRPEDQAALRTAADRVAVDDARAVLAWLATRQPTRRFDRASVVALGRGFGGYLALRALQLEPAVFRGGIAIDAPLDPSPNIGRDIPAELFRLDGADGKTLTVIEPAHVLAQPALLLADPTREAAPDPGVTAGRNASRMAAYRKMEAFLHARLPEFAAKLGPAKEEK